MNLTEETKTEVKHTPGPWGIEQTEACNYIGPMRKDGKKISVIVVANDRASLKPEVLRIRDANAHLIAAAPELLAETQADLHWIENLIGDIRAGRPLIRANIEAGLLLRRDSLRETIAKAKGASL